jgi:hypothetical protein
VTRALPILLLAVAAATGAGCGDDQRVKPRTPVRLTLAAPRDGVTTREDTARVSGRVSPGNARVLVLGERVSVSGGRFETSVDLREGSNVIDVGASAPGARATWRALRVTRRSAITLPDVVGQETVDAVKTLEALGFKVAVTIDEGLLDAFRNRPRVVCESTPQAGSQLEPGGEVELLVAKRC